jgi:NADH-quinone oxidoreductase subunit J
VTARLLLVLCFLGIICGTAAAQTAAGQAPAAPGQVPGQAPSRPPPGAELAPGKLEIVPASAETPKPPADRDRTEGSGKGMALLFWLFAGITIAGSIFVITRRNLIAAVMGMVGTFFGVAALYMMLYAHFLAVIQMLVYAGAIMVLFVFVVMILNKPEDEPWALTGLPGKLLAGLAMLYLTFRLGGTLWSVKPSPEALLAPKPVPVLVDVNRTTGPVYKQYAWGSTGAVGSNLFDEYLFPFEAISILLLVAVVGAIAVARPLKDDEASASGLAGPEEIS